MDDFIPFTLLQFLLNHLTLLNAASIVPNCFSQFVPQMERLSTMPVNQKLPTAKVRFSDIGCGVFKMNENIMFNFNFKQGSVKSFTMKLFSISPILEDTYTITNILFCHDCNVSRDFDLIQDEYNIFPKRYIISLI